MSGNSLYSSRAALSHRGRGRGTRASRWSPGDSPAPQWAAAGVGSGTRGVLQVEQPWVEQAACGDGVYLRGVEEE